MTHKKMKPIMNFPRYMMAEIGIRKDFANGHSIKSASKGYSALSVSTIG
jgi:hypothetical protein